MNANERDILLDVKNLHTHFISGHGKTKVTVKAVNGVSFQVKNGETFGLVGESGCGKTTLGRTIIRLYNPSSGEVTFGGRIISGKKDAELQKFLTSNIAMVFQDPIASLNPRMTVGQIIGEGLLAHGFFEKNDDKMQDYVMKIMEECGLAPYMIHRYPHQFSGGQRQRIGIARSLALKPKFVVCDEAVSALDVSIQSQIVNLLKDLGGKENLAYLFISHGLSVVKYISDRIGVMYLGNIVELATSKGMFDHPMHPYTEALLSAIPTTDPDHKKEIVPLEGDIPSPVHPPEGCKFHTRCKYCQEICKHVTPELRELEEGHYVACHFPLEKKQEEV